MTSNIWNGFGSWTDVAEWSLGAPPPAPPGAAQNVLIQTGTLTLSTAAYAANIVIDNNAAQTLFVTGASATLTAANLTAFGNFYVDTNFADGGSAIAFSGTFVNFSNAVIGNSGLTSSVTVTVAHYISSSLSGYGNLTLQGDRTPGTSFQAALIVNSAAPAVLLGTTYLGGDALLQYQSGGVTTIGTGAALEIYGRQARVSIGAGTGNSALTGLSYILGALDLEGDSATSPGGATVATTPSLLNGGALRLDVNSGCGASHMTVGGALTNTGAIVVGNSTLAASASLTIGNLINQGSINLWGDRTLNATNQAELDVLAAAPSTWTGGVFLHGDSDVVFASGGIASLAAGAQIQIDGQQARLSIGAGPENSALTGLASNYGIFDEEGGASTGAGGAVVATTALFTNYGKFRLDADSGGGASAFTDTMLFTNDDNIQIGNDFLSANTTLTVANLANNGTLFVDSQRAAGANPQAAAMVNSAAPSVSTGYLRLAGDSLVHYLSGAIASIGAGAGIELDGNAASIAIGAGARNSALATLASNAGAFVLRGGNGFGLGVALTTGAYDNFGATHVDYENGDGGSTWTIGGALTNSGEFDIGNTSLSAGATVTATAFNNVGEMALQGGGGAARLAIAGKANPTVGGAQRVGGAATLSYGSGVGYTSISSAGSLELDGRNANIKVGAAGAQNSGVAALALDAGAFVLRGGSGWGAGGAIVNTGVSLSNSGVVSIDNGDADGGSALSIGGTLTNSKTLNIGNASLSAATTVSATGFVNTGALTLQGGAGLSAPAATFNVTAASPASVGAFMRIGGAAKLHFGPGTGFGGVVGAGWLELDGAQANVSVGTGGPNSGLANLAYNRGTLVLRGDSGLGQGGVALTTATNFVNLNLMQIDEASADGGSAVTFRGALVNRNIMDIGNVSLSAATIVQATTLGNYGSLALQGSFYGAGPRATLALSGASPGAVTNLIRIGGTATMRFGSGTGIKTIVSGGSLELDGAQAQVVAGAGGPTSGLANIVSNAGTLLLRGNSNFGQGGVTLATAGGYNNLGTTLIDDYSGDGGGDVTFNGALTNQGTFNLGNTGMSVTCRVNVTGVSNLAGQIAIQGGSAAAILSVTGAVANYAGMLIGANAQLDATGAYLQTGGATRIDGTLSCARYTQGSGTTTVNATLASAVVDAHGGAIVYNSALTAASLTTSLTMQNGAVLQFNAGVSSSQTIAFQDATDLLQLYAPTTFQGDVAGFAGGDAIELMHQASATSLRYAGGILSVLDVSSNVLDSFKLGGGAYTTSSFSLVDDLNGGKLIFV